MKYEKFIFRLPGMSTDKVRFGYRYADRDGWIWIKDIGGGKFFYVLCDGCDITEKTGVHAFAEISEKELCLAGDLAGKNGDPEASGRFRAALMHLKHEGVIAYRGVNATLVGYDDRRDEPVSAGRYFALMAPAYDDTEEACVLIRSDGKRILTLSPDRRDEALGIMRVLNEEATGSFDE